MGIKYYWSVYVSFTCSVDSCAFVFLALCNKAGVIVAPLWHRACSGHCIPVLHVAWISCVSRELCVICRVAEIYNDAIFIINEYALHHWVKFGFTRGCTLPLSSILLMISMTPCSRSSLFTLRTPLYTHNLIYRYLFIACGFVVVRALSFGPYALCSTCFNSWTLCARLQWFSLMKRTQSCSQIIDHYVYIFSSCVMHSTWRTALGSSWMLVIWHKTLYAPSLFCS